MFVSNRIKVLYYFVLFYHLLKIRLRFIGTFSFGSCAKFKSNTIMEFIENAVESSRSGRFVFIWKCRKIVVLNCGLFLYRYLFFFHRRPEHGPMRVQLTNPVSRFRHIQSLQHMCRYIFALCSIFKLIIYYLFYR